VLYSFERARASKGGSDTDIKMLRLISYGDKRTGRIVSVNPNKLKQIKEKWNREFTKKKLN